MVRQISISETHDFLFGQEPSSDPDGAPGSPPRVPSTAEEGKGVGSGGQDIGPEQPVQPQSLEPKEESGPGPEAHFPWGLPGAPTEESGSLVAAALKVLIPLESGPPPQATPPHFQTPAGPSKQFHASYPDDKDSWPGPIPAKPPRQREALQQDPHTAGSEPGLGSPGAIAFTPGLAEPFQGPEPGAQVPTEGSEQGMPGPDVQEGHPGGLREVHSQVLGPDGLPALPHQSLEEEPRAEERKQVGKTGQGLSSEQSAEAQGLKIGHSELPQQDSLPAPHPHDTLQAQAEAEALAPGKLSPPREPLPSGAQPRGGAGPQEPTQTLPTMAELKAQPVPPPTTPTEGEHSALQSRDPRAENRPEDPGTDSGEAGLTSSPGYPPAGQPPADPDYIFHIIFLGDSNVGKTSFLHLLHQNSFPTGLTATVGKGHLGRAAGAGGETQGSWAMSQSTAIPEEASGSVWATGPSLDGILYGPTFTILLSISNYR